ncbi:CLK4-associating serine/arginine rich protein-like isoform X2 [Olea europaea var. sylvestris]|uniref:CLK4-associating serine/arginine rich protein-like isoform X2 n=1 Tax=Olea europaea var. sylvestris TaxID=158386 RepID=UPI000C1D564D|nr:CLK4-associating serine/arginine rich protein-like isoform X2 [Olea europaea var. sylvestris]
MWHEARRSEKKVHEMMDAARKRAQRRAIYLAKRRGDPSQSIQAVGTRCRIHRDDALYQATEDQQGLIPWNGKQDIMIDRFDGRALLDFIRDGSTRRHRVSEITEEEEELEEFVSFERYRDLIKHRRRGFTDKEGLQHVNQEMEAKISAYFGSDSKSHADQTPASKGPYSQVGFSYDGDEKEEAQDLDGDEDDDEDDDYEEDFNSDDSNDELMESIAKEFGVKRYGWLVYMDKRAKEEERRQKEVIKGDPSIRKLSRKERRKVSQMEREKEREAARITGTRVLRHDPYRESRHSPTYEAYSQSRRLRSKSRSYSPSQSRRHAHGSRTDDLNRGKDRAPKIEYITEFGGFDDGDEPKLEGYSPPPSPSSRADALNRPSSGRILEALHADPASGVSLDREKNAKLLKPPMSTSSALAKLSKTTSSGSLSKQLGEKKETPQERLKRIMSKQLNKQIKKDTAIEMAKKREQERQRLEKLAETSRVSRYRQRSRSRSYSRSPPRYTYTSTNLAFGC